MIFWLNTSTDSWTQLRQSPKTTWLILGKWPSTSSSRIMCGILKTGKATQKKKRSWTASSEHHIGLDSRADWTRCRSEDEGWSSTYTRRKENFKNSRKGLNRAFLKSQRSLKSSLQSSWKTSSGPALRMLLRRWCRVWSHPKEVSVCWRKSIEPSRRETQLTKGKHQPLQLWWRKQLLTGKTMSMKPILQIKKLTKDNSVWDSPDLQMQLDPRLGRTSNSSSNRKKCSRLRVRPNSKTWWGPQDNWHLDLEEQSKN